MFVPSMQIKLWSLDMDFREKQNFYTGIIDNELDKMLKVPQNLQKEVYEAMRYSLMAGGKRLRPMLTLSVCDMLGGNIEDALIFGTAIECIHTYSLIHDDLPCMDNDDLRRGMPTCHKAFGETTALLAGDGLLTYAFEHMAEFERYKSVSAETAIRIIALVAKGAGCDGMIGGQVVDLMSENAEDVSEELLGYMHSRKTGALIRVSALAGAMVGGADREQLEKITAFADKLGLAFQIRDDILDYIGDENELGKNIGSDAENMKTTYVTLLGIDGAQNRLDEVSAQAVEMLDSFDERADFLRSLTEYLTKRKN